MLTPISEILTPYGHFCQNVKERKWFAKLLLFS